MNDYKKRLMNSFMIPNRERDIVEFSPDEDIVRSVIGVCSREHLDTCGCQDTIVRGFQRTHMEATCKELKQKGFEHDLELHNRRFKLDKLHGIKDAIKMCEQQGICCPYEVKTLQETMTRSMAKYDLDDSRAYSIIRSILSHQLSVVRMQSYSNKHGVVEQTWDRDGISRNVLNPTEEAKRRFDDSLVKAVVELDKIFEGSKHQIKGTLETISVEELFGQNEDKEFERTVVKVIP